MSDDEAKEWVTIKIPETIRDDARDDTRTYGEIMRAGLDETPVPNAEIPENVVREALYDALDGVEPTVEVDGLPERLDRVESAVGTVEERTGRIERTLEELGGHQ